jgi:putative PIN family toxin of toxin-antitoxin system
MRVVLDTNVLISALLQPAGRSANVYEAWDDARFGLLYCDELIAEFHRVSRSSKLSALISKSLAGRMVNDVRSYGIHIGVIPDLDASPDPWDNFLLALAEAGAADYLVTGDKADLLALGKHGSTKIVSVREFVELLGS